ncbi:lantibiotic dehydratase C-terminal domain-containing protein [Streptomyces chartreusis]|uniref:lantibiotic dehydratase C-terminal domain-containing protein n=1 Tax=Streptomyces chartreusis TaxID=1969 RepID=UPI0036399BA1
MPSTADAPTTSGHWTSVHLFHQGDLDTLLLDAVVPALADVGPGIRGHFFLRYWEGGPHLRVRLLSTDPPGAATDAIAEELLARWNDWLANHPSPRSVDEAAYLRFATESAVREGLLGFEPWRDLHDCAVPRTYVPERDRYGTGASLAAVERHFMEASRCAEALLARRPGTAERLSAGFAVLLLTWAVVEPDARRRRDALQAGAEAWQRMLGPAYGRDEFDRAYRGSRAALTRRANQLLTTGRQVHPGGSAGPLSEWHNSIARLYRTLQSLEMEGEFRPDLDSLRDDPSLLALPRSRAALTANRCAHLMCNRLGLHGPQEALLRHFAARAADDLHSAAWTG